MSVVLNDKPRQSTLKWRWPLSRELTLSVATLAVLLITHDIEEAIFMATELVLLSPGPGRVVERLRLDFSRRFVAGESCRSIKSDPRFIEQREYILSRVFDQREAFS